MSLVYRVRDGQLRQYELIEQNSLYYLLKDGVDKTCLGAVRAYHRTPSAAWRQYLEELRVIRDKAFQELRQLENRLEHLDARIASALQRSGVPNHDRTS
jgi:hypothetical protein